MSEIQDNLTDSMSGGQTDARIRGLDGLRAIAIFLVVWLHAVSAGYFPSPHWLPFSGKLGVSLFFVLSGFLITSLLLKARSGDRRIDLFRFYLRRSLRIFPAFYAYLVFLLLSPSLMEQMPTTNSRSWMASAVYALNFMPRGRDHNVMHIWSLCVEEQFYLLWPLIFSRLSRARALAFSLAVFGLWPLARLLTHWSSPPPVSELLQASSFETLMLGCALALAVDRWPRFGLRLRDRAATVLGAGVCLIGVFALHRHVPLGLSLLVPVGRDLLLAYIVWWVVHSPKNWLVKVLDWRPVAWLGTLSYSLYLWHMPFLRMGAGPFPRGYCSWFAIALFTLASYYLVEQPFLRLRARYFGVKSTNSADLTQSTKRAVTPAS